jgi:hypothetical protein
MHHNAVRGCVGTFYLWGEMTEAEKAYQIWLTEQQVAGCWFDPERLKSDYVHGYESTFKAGYAARDAKIAELEERVAKLEHKLEMRRSSVRDALERNGLESGVCQDGVDHIDLITGKIR